MLKYKWIFSLENFTNFNGIGTNFNLADIEFLLLAPCQVKKELQSGV